MVNLSDIIIKHSVKSEYKPICEASIPLNKLFQKKFKKGIDKDCKM